VLRSSQLLFALGLGLTGLGAVAACSSDSSGAPSSAATPTTVPVTQGTVLKVGDLAAAVQAVEATRGGPQRYVELNATPDGVNVFVAEAGDELAYYFTGGQLQPPAAPVPQSSPPFTLDGVDLGLAPALVERTQQQFPGSVVTSLALVDVDDQGLRWALRSRSARGGLVNVFYTPTGELASVAPAD
jgi:hypothetical protein